MMLHIPYCIYQIIVIVIGETTKKDDLRHEMEELGQLRAPVYRMHL